MSGLPPENNATALEEVGSRADTVRTRGEGAPPRIATAAAGPLSGPAIVESRRGRRVAIVDGCRTPFARAGSELSELDVVDLAGAAAAEVVTRSGVDPESIGMSIFGVVVPSLEAPNLGREVVFRASLPHSLPGTSVNLACASSNRAITSGAEAILTGQAEVVLAGGAESLSNIPIRYSDRAASILTRFSKAKSLGARVSTLAEIRPRDLVPVAPAIAEYTTGMTMGQAAEKMAQENNVSRRAQDEISLMSHQRAAAAQAEGRFAEQIVKVFPRSGDYSAVAADNGVRADTSMEALAGLRPVFDKRYGTLTAGNSSPITDGGSAVLLMREDTAKAAGLEPLGYLRSWAYSALDPGSQLLQGPAYAAPAALDRAGVTLGDIDLVEMHEAFAAQLLSNLKAFASRKFAREELGREAAVGEVDFDRLNVNGGSLAIGHPFAATGARVTFQLLFEMRRRDVDLGLLTVCAAGGVGFAMVVERE